MRNGTYGDFAVSLSRHVISSVVQRTRRLWRRLGDFETSSLGSRLERVPITTPVWIAGLARAGSTILLEVLASARGVATHQYRDFPFLHTPYWRRRFLRIGERGTPEPVERAHRDRLQVTPHSPEAMEEMLWMCFFPGLHDPERSSVLDRRSDNRPFEAFFKDHIRKLLLVSQAERYVAKANYNLTRLPYLLRLFPDARFIVPIRRPSDHIASLMKQHTLFLRAARERPRSVSHLNHVGHFEFGANRIPINAGDEDMLVKVRADWREGREIRGWSRYWSHVYGWLADRLRDDPELRAATLVVRYEDLCSGPEDSLCRILEHARLDTLPATRFASAIAAPTYYSPDFSQRENQVIATETRTVARAYGYGPEE